MVGVAVRHLHLTVADAVMMITEESHYFSGGSSQSRQTHEIILLRGNDNPMIMDRIKEIFEPFQVDADKMMKELGNNI